MMFRIDEKEASLLRKWMEEQDKKVIQQQKGTELDIENGLPNYGCNGEGYIYSFTPNSLGTICIVRNKVTNEEIDLTDYSTW